LAVGWSFKVKRIKARGESTDGGTPASSAHSLEAASSRLVNAVMKVLPETLERIRAKQRQDQWDRDDFIWEALLISMATMGNSRGAQLVEEERHHQRVRWDRLVNCSPNERERELANALASAKVRMPQKKAAWLAKNFERIDRDGGPKMVKSMLSQCQGRDAKIQFLYSFDGIGPKYARNMLMDVYHPDFRESIAIDERIKKISSTLRLSFRKYSDAERFYLDVAHRAGLNGWELDRLLYGYTDHVVEALNQSGH
jgi:thermostable 8-oxoguanine DNA glycosylase